MPTSPTTAGGRARPGLEPGRDTTRAGFNVTVTDIGWGDTPSNHWPESMIRRISFTAFSKAVKPESEKSMSPTSSTYPAAVL